MIRRNVPVSDFDQPLNYLVTPFVPFVALLGKLRSKFKPFQFHIMRYRNLLMGQFLFYIFDAL